MIKILLFQKDIYLSSFNSILVRCSFKGKVPTSWNFTFFLLCESDYQILFFK